MAAVLANLSHWKAGISGSSPNAGFNNASE